MRITIKQIMDAVTEEIRAALGGEKVEVYFGNLSEGLKRPAILLSPIFFNESRLNPATTRKTLELQVIYFGRTDGAGQERYSERMVFLERLDGFLQRFELQVSDRWLHFDCELKDADGQLALYLHFQFLDEAAGEAAEDAETASVAEVRFRVKGT